MKRHTLVTLLIAIPWTLCVFGGMGLLLSYSSTPGVAASPGERWPEESRLPRVPDRPTLVLFAHPQCPCTKATIGELARFAAACKDRATVDVVFVRPQGTDEAWARGDLWESAASIPGVNVLEDDGAETRRFGAVVSGQTILYDTDGALRFSGGITAARGHSGDNRGLDAVVSLVNTGRSDTERAPVFGCTLLDDPAPQ